ncbi:hypothetical protein UlMin_039762 [Ulmus minor]
MIEQVHRGNRQNNSFGKKAWKHMRDEFYKKTGLNWDKEQLKNRYAVLRRQYGIVNSLLSHNDFAWNETTRTIVASREAWAEYIRAHPDAESIKTGGCPTYRELCIIFSESPTNGRHEQSSVLVGGTTTPSSFVPPEPLCILQEESSESEEAEDVDERDRVQPTTPSTTGVQPSTPSTSGVRKRGRKGVDDAIADAILQMAAASKLRTTVIQQCKARYSITNCIKVLDEMRGVDEQLYFAALDLFNKPVAREMFLSLKVDKRLTWLRGKCMLNPVFQG